MYYARDGALTSTVLTVFEKTAVSKLNDWMEGLQLSFSDKLVKIGLFELSNRPSNIAVTKCANYF